MKLTLAILVTLLGMAAGILAEEKKQRQYNPKEIGVDKTKSGQRKDVKWEGPEFDATKNERKAKQKTKD